jgi:flagellar biosynthetic protein FliO
MEDGFSFGLQMLRMAGSLALVLGLMAIALYGIKRLGLRVRKAETNPWIQVLAQYPLGVKHYLLLVKIQRQILLLGVSPQGVHLLTLLPESPENSTGIAQ